MELVYTQNSGQGKAATKPTPVLLPTMPPIQQVRVNFPGFKRQECDDQPLSSTTDVLKTMWSLSSKPPAFLNSMVYLILHTTIDCTVFVKIPAPRPVLRSDLCSVMTIRGLIQKSEVSISQQPHTEGFLSATQTFVSVTDLKTFAP